MQWRGEEIIPTFPEFLSFNMKTAKVFALKGRGFLP